MLVVAAVVVADAVAQQLEPLGVVLVALEEQEHHVRLDNVDPVDNIDSWIEDAADTLDIHIEALAQVHTAAHTLDSIP